MAAPTESEGLGGGDDYFTALILKTRFFRVTIWLSKSTEYELSIATEDQLEYIFL